MSGTRAIDAATANLSLLSIVGPALIVGLLYYWQIVWPRRRRQRDRTTPIAGVAITLAEIDDFWEDGVDSAPEDRAFGQREDARWFVTYAIYLTDNLGRAVGSWRWASMDSMLILYSVCSPALRRDLPSKLRQSLHSALVQDRYDHDAAIAALQTWLGDLEPLTPEAFVGRLMTKAYVPKVELVEHPSIEP